MTNEEKFLICDWFDHLAQLAKDHKTQTGIVMDNNHCFAEMYSLASNASHFVKKFGDDPNAFIIK